jgi:DNA polymerase III subunit chi
MAEALFYHLEHFPLERVLPSLIEKSLERNWRVIVRSGSQERLDALDLHLWTYRDDSFLPHGTAKDGPAEAQPVYLTLANDNPNDAHVLFLVEGAEFGDQESYERIVYLFDGRDEDALAQARASWKIAKATGIPTTYWQQEAAGRWVKRA